MDDPAIDDQQLQPHNMIHDLKTAVETGPTALA
jgi:hypothetical protein